ncbi:MAG: hypothetical protein IK095_05715 [Oscillospiraceae bacterium]|nr:hypothetical protein [Oscillospiraceae bacterium]
MKRLLALLLALCTLLALCGCGGQAVSEPEAGAEEEEEKAEEEPGPESLEILLMAVEAVAKMRNSNCEIHQTETADEIQFTAGYYEPDLYDGVICRYSGTATKDGRVKTLEHSFGPGEEDREPGYLEEIYQRTSFAGAKEMIAGDLRTLTMNELRYYLVLSYFCIVLDDFRNGTVDQEVSRASCLDILDTLFASQQGPQTVDGWIYTMALEDDGNTVKIGMVREGS